MAWVGNWNYINSGIKTNQEDMPVTSKRLGAYTLARKLVLNNDNTISSTPITTNLEEKKVVMKLMAMLVLNELMKMVITS